MDENLNEIVENETKKSQPPAVTLENRSNKTSKSKFSNLQRNLHSMKESKV